MEAEPVSGGAFFGRQDLLERLNKRFEAFESGYRQNIGLIGQPWFGKSSILAQFLRTHSFKGTIPIFIRIEETDSFQTFSQKWLGSILYAYQRHLALPRSKDYQSLVKQMRRKLPLRPAHFAGAAQTTAPRPIHQRAAQHGLRH